MLNAFKIFILINSVSLLSSCAITRARCPGEGGAPWRELTTQHFIIKTNLKSEVARNAAISLEKYRASVLQATSLGEVDPPGQIETIVLANEMQLEEFQPSLFRGYMKRRELGQPIIVVASEGYLAADSILENRLITHELVHYFNSFMLARQPQWLSEGLAMFFETVETKKERIIFGHSDAKFLLSVSKLGRRSLNDLWKWNEFASNENMEETAALYTSSWFLVHYLFRQHASQFKDFLNRLARSEDPRTAWETSFPGLSGSHLERLLDDYKPEGRFSLPAPKFVESNWIIQERSLREAEIHVIRADLIAESPLNTLQNRKAGVEKELALGLQHDPNDHELRVLQIRIAEPDSAIRAELARMSTLEKPDDPRGWIYLAYAMKSSASDAEIVRVLRKAVETGPNLPVSHEVLAFFLAKQGHWQEALPHALRAVELDPGNWQASRTAAIVYAVARDCPHAIEFQTRAMEALPEKTPKQLRTQIKNGLEKTIQLCSMK